MTILQITDNLTLQLPTRTRIATLGVCVAEGVLDVVEAPDVVEAREVQVELGAALASVVFAGLHVSDNAVS